jgi:hypothetical protein
MNEETTRLGLRQYPWTFVTHILRILIGYRLWKYEVDVYNSSDLSTVGSFWHFLKGYKCNLIKKSCSTDMIHQIKSSLIFFCRYIIIFYANLKLVFKWINLSLDGCAICWNNFVSKIGYSTFSKVPEFLTAYYRKEFHVWLFWYCEFWYSKYSSKIIQFIVTEITCLDSLDHYTPIIETWQNICKYAFSRNSWQHIIEKSCSMTPTHQFSLLFH